MTKPNSKLNTEQLIARIGQQYAALNNGITGQVSILRSQPVQAQPVQVPPGQKVKTTKPLTHTTVTVGPPAAYGQVPMPFQNPALTQPSPYLNVVTHGPALDDALRKLTVTLETYVKRELQIAQAKLDGLQKAAAEIEG